MEKQTVPSEPPPPYSFPTPVAPSITHAGRLDETENLLNKQMVGACADEEDLFCCNDTVEVHCLFGLFEALCIFFQACDE